MNSHLLKLATRKGELKATMEMQRNELALHAQALSPLFSAADHTIDAVHWVKRNPGAVAAAVVGVAIVRPRRAFRFAKRLIGLWQSIKLLQSRLPPGLI